MIHSSDPRNIFKQIIGEAGCGWFNKKTGGELRFMNTKKGFNWHRGFSWDQHSDLSNKLPYNEGTKKRGVTEKEEENEFYGLPGGKDGDSNGATREWVSKYICLTCRVHSNMGRRQGIRDALK